MTVRTLKNWEVAAAQPVKRLGRPPHNPSRRYHAARLVRRELEAQGWTAGWRPVRAALAGRETRYEVERNVRAWKARHRKRVAGHRAAHRVHVEVLAQDAIWTQDATHVGRVGRLGVEAEVIRDRATFETVDLEVGASATGEEIVAQLERLKATRGLPLVWQTDNGGAYRDERVAAWCAREHVVHLRSRPHLPQDNGVAERGIRELKEEAELGRGVRVEDAREAAVRLESARARLDGRRVRVARGGTSVALGRILPRCYDAVDATVFHRRACKAMKRAAAGCTGARAKRGAEGAAVYALLERLGMIRRTRGGEAMPIVKPEGLS